MSTRRTVGRFGALAVAGVLGVMSMVGTARAQDAAPAAAPAGPNTGNISLSAGMDIVSQYWFRGLAQENQGMIFQPWAEIGVSLYQKADNDTGPIDSVGLAIGTWNSMHTGPTGSEDVGGVRKADPAVWYEGDWYFKGSLGVGDFGLSATFTEYTSPNNSFTTTEEIAFGVSYNDAELWSKAGVSFPGFGGLQPAVTIGLEIDGGADGGATLGKYFQVGVGPTFTVIDSKDYPITLKVPMTLGFGSDYYEDGLGNDNTFGFFDMGAELSTPLSFIPASYGSWSAYVGVHFIALGDTAQTIAGPTGLNITHGDSTEVYTKFGFSMSY